MAAPKGKKSGSSVRRPAAVAADAIVDAALNMAEAEGWNEFRLSDLAASLGLSPAQLQAQFRDKDAIADAWFARALAAMLAPAPHGFATMPVRTRLELLLLRWFDALAPHRAVTADMLQAKLWYAHPHHYVPMVFSLSRLIQWLRDAAGMTAGGRQRQVEEIGLTLLFLDVLRRWCRDGGEDQQETRDFLARRLDRADRLAARWFHRCPAAGEQAA